MTEEQWRTSSAIQTLLGMAPGVGPRKVRLTACAGARRVWDVMGDERCWRAVELAEASADRSVPYRDLDHASGAAEEAFEEMLADQGDEPLVVRCARAAASYASNPDLLPDHIIGIITWAAAVERDGEWAAHAAIIRDVFGSPFRPVAVEPGWRTEAVVALARAIYDDRAFDRLPVLADALEDAGCANADLLGHLRDPALTHVRGCWAVDLMLGFS